MAEWTPRTLVLSHFGDDDANVEQGLRARYGLLLEQVNAQPSLQGVLESGAEVVGEEPFTRYLTVDNSVIPLTIGSVCTEALRLQKWPTTSAT